eukprot:3196075-Rhodomonas_salina.1
MPLHSLKRQSCSRRIFMSCGYPVTRTWSSTKAAWHRWIQHACVKPTPASSRSRRHRFMKNAKMEGL